MKGTQTWMPQVENSAGMKKEFHSQIYFNVNNDMQQHGTILT
jgi:hypothetical protein